MWYSIYNRLIRETVIPLGLMISTPNVVVLLPYIIVHHKADLFGMLQRYPLGKLLRHVWNSMDLFDLQCWTIVFVTLLWAAASLLIIPGKKYFGPPTINNYRPEYWDSGFRFYLISMSLLIPVVWQNSMLGLYYKIPNFMAVLVFFGFIVSVLVYFKGLIAPDPGIYDVTKNPIFDFYRGVELYPQLGRYIHLKVLINSRFGLWLWQAIVIVCWKAHYELYISSYNKGFVFYPITTITILQTIYLAKFYYWEDGYMQTIDIALDRFGFMIAWGCIAFVPGFFCLGSLYLVKNSPTIAHNFLINLVILIFGLFAIFANYWVDYQRQIVRETDGRCTIWFQKPTIIRAKYIDSEGNEKNSLLLASGFWGLARHLNYFFEILISISFGLPALNTSLLPYFYTIFIIVLLIHRTTRDDKKCSEKYGQYWKEYCRKVPYRMVPFVF